ncbi:MULTISPECIES: fluoride efflux transporter CrcB [Mycolicibacterium]|uniref:Fluoride-specific ion channel FluC n=1 Tax=Mycolicibacterium neoaurum TaxID=1795 RepID=A0AAV2WFR1_MYCNE|nr:fluoride efflux transporter CrcB [Mycolicibacterium neoaurum]QVI26719.1 fluoride efflux transporter CrcB [Mycolicibacterium neoaurum]TLH61987.1 fluoride efflux transporter CrcB [Mycolicibacterium neoaurum]CDQ42781.1 camphor resistance protein CrcB [Mycolicibacterium neoaurum]SDE79295.1 camphor resistance protein CrcB [Mycolicibacterium neoaurum]
MALTDRRELAAVFVGGGIGTLARAGLVHVLAVPPGHWPWATFIVNIVGAALLGVVATRLAATDYRRSLLGTGLCGGLTTFSTMQVETVTMLEHGQYALAAGYGIISIALGLAVMHLCTVLARRGMP